MKNLKKTRVSSKNNSNNKPKIKWWYLLPIIIVVAAAGYLIVRYSNAGAKQFRRVYGQGLQGRTTFTKPPWPVPLYTATPNNPVVTTVGKKPRESREEPMSKNSPIAGRQICAYVWGAKNSAGGSTSWRMDVNYYSERSVSPIRLAIVNGAVQFNAVPANYPKAGSASVSGSTSNGWQRKCTTVPSRGKTLYDRPYFATVKVYPFNTVGRPGVNSSVTSTPNQNSRVVTTTPGQFGVAEVWVQ
jgi:hypothetical protein